VYLKAASKNSRNRKRGIALVLVLFVMAILLTVTLVMSFVYYTEVLSASRSVSAMQAFFVSEGGQEYGRRLLDETLQHFSVSGAVTEADLEQYGSWAESGNRANDDDIGVLRDFVVDFDKFLPRNTMGVISGELGEGTETLEYELAYDFTPTGVDYPAPGDESNAFTYHYEYEIQALGRKPGTTLKAEQETRMTGALSITIFRPSFSFYDFFTVIMQISGQQIYFAADEVLDGPVYVGSRPGFAGDNQGGGPTFTDQFQSTWDSYATSSKVYNPVVTWNPEYPPLWAVDAVPVPSNAYSQERVSMGREDLAGDTSAVTNAERRGNLGLLPGTTAPPQGVYYAKGDGTNDEGNNVNELLGGIYVYGDVQGMDLGASGSHQYINIQQSGVWTYIDVDNAAGTTKVKKGAEGTWKTHNGTPNGVAYVNGTLNDLGRGSSYTSAIEEDTQMTIAASKTIYIDNHLNYEVDPRDDPEADNVLGIFSGTGNVLIANDAPSNINVHATMMATRDGYGFGVQDFRYKPPSGALNVLGGIIMHTYQAIGTFDSYGQVSGYYKNFIYDRRFLDPTFHPPYFPVVSPYVGRLRSINRTDWTQVIPPPPEE